MVFAGLYPTNNADYEALRDALSKLQLNDSAFFYEPDTSGALGFGFRCGFLGLLHMEIVQERLEREFNLDLITTAPGVRYRITTQKGEVMEIHNPSKLPEPNEIALFEEPMIKAMILTNDDYVGPILKLAEEKARVRRASNTLRATAS
jgi:GTP-binding protein LepA